jgi:starvation-inducible DNA-binding protein
MIHTKNGIPVEAREYIINSLQTRLAEGVDLMQQCKHAHWNISGASFSSLHLLFDSIHTELEACVDQVAERIVQLGGEAGGTWQSIAKLTRLPSYPIAIDHEYEHLDFLSTSIAKFSEGMRHDVFDPILSKDPVTKDLLVKVSTVAEKSLWLVESNSTSGNKSDSFIQSA